MIVNLYDKQKDYYIISYDNVTACSVNVINTEIGIYNMVFADGLRQSKEYDATRYSIVLTEKEQ